MTLYAPLASVRLIQVDDDRIAVICGLTPPGFTRNLDVAVFDRSNPAAGIRTNFLSLM